MESGINEKKICEHPFPRILFISSADPTKSAGALAMDFYEALKCENYPTDLLTKFPVAEHNEILWICKPKKQNLFYKFYVLGEKVVKHVRHFLLKDVYPTSKKGGSCFFYKKETPPPVAIHKVIDKISPKYDCVMILFWQELLSYQTVEAIYDRLRVPIFFIAADYSPITGGCHFIGDCDRFKTGCGCCPAWNSKNPEDFTHFNILFRKSVINKIEPILFINSYMKRFVDESVLFKGRITKLIFPVINESIFCIRDKENIQKDLGIPKEKFVLYFASQHLNDPRKGIRYLLEALELFSKKLDVNERDSIFVITAGHTSRTISSNLPFAHKEFGFVETDSLPLLASAANLFLCSSINDAGPMMVNQSLSCGVPVVAFEVGVALDVVKNKGTGYCAKIKDTTDFANKIYKIFKADTATYGQMVENCRKVALETTSRKATVVNLMSVYQSLKNNTQASNEDNI